MVLKPILKFIKFIPNSIFSIDATNHKFQIYFEIYNLLNSNLLRTIDLEKQIELNINYLNFIIDSAFEVQSNSK
jgi:hypothetical protein